MNREGKCHICNSETDIECTQCQCYTCDSCLVSLTQFNQIDFDLCTSCGDQNEADYADQESKREEIEAEEEQKRLARNQKARDRYRLPKNKKKREEKRKLLLAERRKRQEESAARLGKILSNIFK